MNNNHLSITQIKMYLRCPLQYKFRYVDGLKIPPVSAITLGKTKQDLPVQRVTDLFSDLWESEVKKLSLKKAKNPVR